jgi:small-conductance mechanosensitive channel
VVAIVALTLQLGLFVNAALRFITRRFTEQPGAPSTTATAVSALSFATQLLLYTVLLLLALANLGVNVSTLLTGLGVGGIAVALALQSVLKDILGAVTIVINKPFLVGDLIEVDEFLGVVNRVDMRSTRLTNLSGEELSMPNQHLLDGVVRNHSRMRQRRVSFVLSIHHGTPVRALAEVGPLVRESIAAVSSAIFERAQLKRVTPGSFEFEVVYCVDSADYDLYAAVNHDVLMGILQRLEARGVALAMPLFASGSVSADAEEASDSPSVPVQR